VQASLNKTESKSDISEEDKFNQWYEKRRTKEVGQEAHSEADKIL
jgi:hypothetical protein